MEQIRREFVTDVEAITRQAMGLHVILMHGFNMYRAVVAPHPDATVIIGTGDPNAGGGRMVTHVPTHREVVDAFTESPNLIMERSLSAIVQLWNDFLCDVFRAAVRESMKVPGRYDVPRLEALRIDNFSQLDEGHLPDAVAEAAAKRFDDNPLKDRHKSLAKVLRIDLAHLSRPRPN